MTIIPEIRTIAERLIALAAKATQPPVALRHRCSGCTKPPAEAGNEYDDILYGYLGWDWDDSKNVPEEPGRGVFAKAADAALVEAAFNDLPRIAQALITALDVVQWVRQVVVERDGGLRPASLGSCDKMEAALNAFDLATAEKGERG